MSFTMIWLLYNKRRPFTLNEMCTGKRDQNPTQFATESQCFPMCVCY